MLILEVNLNEALIQIIDILKTIYNVIMVAIPIVLLVIGTIDLAKAVMAGDEKEVKAAVSLLGKRMLIAASAFLVMYIVGIVTDIVQGNEWGGWWAGNNPSSGIKCVKGSTELKVGNSLEKEDIVTCSLKEKSDLVLKCVEDGKKKESNSGTITCSSSSAGELVFYASKPNSDSREYSISFRVKEDPIIIDPIFTLDNCPTGSIDLSKGKTINLGANPSKSLRYSSSNSGVASVDYSGTVTGINLGTASITASSSSKSITCNIEVECGDGYFNYHGQCLKDLHPKFIYDNYRPYISCVQYTQEERALLEKKLEVVVERAGIGTRAAVVEAARFLAGFPYKIQYQGARAHQDIGQYKHKGLYLDPKGGWGCGKNGLDCSDGYIGWVLTNAGFSYDSFRRGKEYKMKDVMDKVKPGDFIFAKGIDPEDGKLKQVHIGIIIGIDAVNVYVGESRGYGPGDGLKVTKINKMKGDSHLAYVYINTKSFNGEGKYNLMWQ